MSSRARHHGSTAVLSPRRPRRTCVRRAPRVPPRVDLQTLHSEHERILMTRRGWRRVGGARPGWQQIQAHDLGQSNCRASLWIMWVPSRNQRQKRRHRALQPASPCHNLCLLCLQSRRASDVLLRTTSCVNILFLYYDFISIHYYQNLDHHSCDHAGIEDSRCPVPRVQHALRAVPAPDTRDIPASAQTLRCFFWGII